MDIGESPVKGSSVYLPDTAQYRITGSGADIGGTADAFHFLWKQISGDLNFSMNVTWAGESNTPQRKTCAMVRASLDPDSPCVNVAVQGDGSIQLQYRARKGGPTLAVPTPVRAPASVRLERSGDVFTAFVSHDGGSFQPIGAFSLALPDPIYVGLAVCSRDRMQLATALISNVQLTAHLVAPNAKRLRESSLETLVVATGERKLIYRDRSIFEAPNWSRDGNRFFLNRMGSIWTLPVVGGEPQKLDTGVAVQINNDHGFSFDGKWLAISSGTKDPGGSKIFVVSAAGGTARQVTPSGPSYWHGWSPDGKSSRSAECATAASTSIRSLPTAVRKPA